MTFTSVRTYTLKPLVSSWVVSVLCGSFLVTGCKKPVSPETIVPVTPVVESVEESTVDVEANTDDVSNTTTEEPTTVATTVDEADISFLSEDEQAKQERFNFVQQVNQAIALLSSTETLQEGLSTLENLDKSNTDNPEIPYNIGVGYLQNNNERSATRAFERAIEIDPTFAKAWFNLGVLKERQGQYEQAIAIYEEGLTHAETDPDLSAGKIACLRKLGKPDEAIAFAQKVLGKNANNITAYSEIGLVYLEQDELDKALFVLQQGLQRNGTNNARLQSVLGQVYYAQEKLFLAENAFSQSLQLDPTLIETSMYLAFLQLQNRAWDKADATLTATLALDPTNAALLNAHGVAKRGQGNIEEAERLYKEAYQNNPSNPEPLLNLAILEADYKEGNQYSKAFDLLDRYLAEGGTDVYLVEQWRAEFKASEEVFLKEKKQQELRDLFRRRREEAAKKRAEEEARQAAEDAQQTEDSEPTEDEDNDENAEEGATEGDSGTGDTESDTSSEDGDDASETESSEETSAIEDGSGEGSDDNGWGEATDTDNGVSIEGDQSGSENTEETDIVEGTIETQETVEQGANDTAPSTEQVDPIQSSTDDSTADESADTETDNGWGVASEGDSDMIAQSCTSQSDCGEDLVCASTGECLVIGEFGTAQIGEFCETSNACALSLECVEQECVSVSSEDEKEAE